MTTDLDRLVSRFNVGEVWLSPMHTYYRVEETNEETGQAVLRHGLQGKYRRIRRPITATKNWTFVAPAVTGHLLNSVKG